MLYFLNGETQTKSRYCARNLYDNTSRKRHFESVVDTKEREANDFKITFFGAYKKTLFS